MAIAPAIDRAVSTAQTTWCEGVRVLVPQNVADLETFVTFCFAPIADESGTVAGVMGTCVDVTENVISARRLATLHRLGTAAPMVRTHDAISTTLVAALRDNPDIEFAALYTADDGTARPLSWIDTGEHTCDVSAEAIAGPVARVLESEEPVEITFGETPAVALPLRGGRGVIGVLVCGVSKHVPLGDAYRSFLELVAAHVSAMLADVTEPDTAHPAVQTPPHLRTKDAFLTVIAHELRNPLSALMTTVQSLMLRTPSSDIELMERSVRRLSDIVDNLLDISRLARGRLELAPRPAELATIVDRAVDRAAALASERNAQVFVRVARAGLQLTADPERIAQAIANLLSNAIRFSEPGGRVWLQATREYDRIRIVIRDEGCGIDPERLAVVFETFYQAPESRPRTAGVGLGLAIARSLIELHGGALQVRSTGSGQGTECIIELPTEARVAPSTPTTAPASRRKVMLVEDNDDTARALKSALEQLGYIVALAHNGPVALNVARTFDPDVVLMDIGLPVMDGWELARRLRDMRGAAHNAPVVAVTAYDREVDKQRSSDAGFADHLVKPIDLAKLQQVVESLPLRPTS